ncbi:MAG: hypothetical protein QOG13_213 [Sphingomonadales bacterium]|jgi:hypothetical protein|nr:hypothetical protein [Sphingomonadales bacterium]
MNKLNKLAMLATVTLLPFAAAAASAQPAPPPAQPPAGPALPLEYAAKFVCGENIAPGASTTLVAFGRYYTAVNIHSPSRRNRLTYKVVWARQGATGQMTNFQPVMDLTYDQALDIDCRLIRARLQQAGIALGPPNVFITGFLVVQSSEPLDVVAVYTAAPTTTNQVASIHTERVPMRQLRD